MPVGPPHWSPKGVDLDCLPAIEYEQKLCQLLAGFFQRGSHHYAADKIEQ